ncbi:hypothetical protein [Haladaptatus sp. YSMS36]|uniref:DUF7315 family membrane protein n=1 Tax=Haladaptatus sp. YSMS36 TaxID=3033384 RepID=UPI0023E7BBC8|nr:hypothetical protein [Haladaptatus sp. YSMS36]
MPPTDEPSPELASEERRARDIEVPIRLYKTVTVFSTLFAVLAVVGGFLVLDVATQQSSLSAEEVNVPIALAGIGLIALGAVVYAFSTRFRAQGMGKSKDDADEPADNG